MTRPREDASANCHRVPLESRLALVLGRAVRAAPLRGTLVDDATQWRGPREGNVIERIVGLTIVIAMLVLGPPAYYLFARPIVPSRPSAILRARPTADLALRQFKPLGEPVGQTARGYQVRRDSHPGPTRCSIIALPISPSPTSTARRGRSPSTSRMGRSCSSSTTATIAITVSVNSFRSTRTSRNSVK